MYFSGGSANFVTFGASTSIPVGSLTLDPGLQMSFVSHTVDVSLLPKNRGKGKGFSLSVTPAYAYSPTDLAVRTSQFLWSAAISYSADF
jgi:hypothetical protein